MRITEQLRLMCARIPEAEASLEQVLQTDALAQRPAHTPDFKAEAATLLTLARTLSTAPQALFQTLCEQTLSLCSARSAGISILEEAEEESFFRCRALAGEMSPHLWGITPQDFSPSGITVKRNAPQLFVQPAQHYPYITSREPPVAELLLVPFHLDEKPVGTLWVVNGAEGRPFDTEDVRLLTDLSTFASAAQQASLNRDALTTAQEQSEGEETAKRVFFEITASPDLTFSEKVQRLLRLGCSQLQLENGIFSRIEGERYIVEQIQAPSHLGILPGVVYDLKDTYSERAIRTTWPIGFERTGESEWEVHPVFRNHKIEAYLGTAIRVGDTVYGTVNFTSLTPRDAPFTNGDREWLQLVARWIGHELEQRKAMEEREHQARLFDTVLSSIVDFAYIFDREGRFTYINQALLDLWQLKLEEARGKNFFELNYPPELAARLQRQIQTVFETKTIVRDETPYTSESGHSGYYEYIFVPVLNSEGNVEVVAGSTRNITDRYQVQAEKETLLKSLELERTRLTSLFMQAPAFVAVLRGPNHIYELVNLPYYQIVGHRELIGKSVREALPELEGQGFFELLDRVWQTGETFVGKAMPLFLHDVKGEPLRERYMDFVYQPLVEADGNISGIFVHGVDLTDRKKAEQERAQREEEIIALNQRLRLAIRETHHRVKNNLQVISAMVEMQVQEYKGAQMVPMEEMVRLHAHVHTLSVVHDLLTRSAKDADDGQMLEAKAVLDSLLPMLQRTAWNQKVRYQIENAHLTAKQCIALSLVLNELVSNSLKHGREKAEVLFQVEGHHSVLTVSDDGDGFPEDFDPLTHANTGLELVNTLVGTDLGGDITYGNHPAGGGQVVVRFPMPELVSRE